MVFTCAVHLPSQRAHNIQLRCPLCVRNPNPLRFVGSRRGPPIVWMGYSVFQRRGSCLYSIGFLCQWHRNCQIWSSSSRPCCRRITLWKMCGECRVCCLCSLLYSRCPQRWELWIVVKTVSLVVVWNLFLSLSIVLFMFVRLTIFVALLLEGDSGCILYLARVARLPPLLDCYLDPELASSTWMLGRKPVPFCCTTRLSVPCGISLFSLFVCLFDSRGCNAKVVFPWGLFPSWRWLFQPAYCLVRLLVPFFNVVEATYLLFAGRSSGRPFVVVSFSWEAGGISVVSLYVFSVSFVCYVAFCFVTSVFWSPCLRDVSHCPCFHFLCTCLDGSIWFLVTSLNVSENLTCDYCVGAEQHAQGIIWPLCHVVIKDYCQLMCFIWSFFLWPCLPQTFTASIVLRCDWSWCTPLSVHMAWHWSP